MTCGICENSMRGVGTQRLLGKYSVEYFFCDGCHYWTTEPPYWLDEAYADAITQTDTGIVERNVSLAKQLLPVLAGMRTSTRHHYVDWAGGSGLFVRLMRDYGLEFLWQDRFSENLFARGFEFSQGNDSASICAVTALEALEHAPDPVSFLSEIFDMTGTTDVILTQELHHGVDFDWWYLSQTGGQHVSFFAARTLSELASRIGTRVYSRGSLHLFTKRDVKDDWFSRQMRLARFRYPLVKRGLTSLTWSDHESLTRT